MPGTPISDTHPSLVSPPALPGAGRWGRYGDPSTEIHPLVCARGEPPPGTSRVRPLKALRPRVFGSSQAVIPPPGKGYMARQPVRVFHHDDARHRGMKKPLSNGGALEFKCSKPAFNCGGVYNTPYMVRMRRATSKCASAVLVTPPTSGHHYKSRPSGTAPPGGPYFLQLAAAAVGFPRHSASNIIKYRLGTAYNRQLFAKGCVSIQF